jgi:hypothetical protein
VKARPGFPLARRPATLKADPSGARQAEGGEARETADLLGPPRAVHGYVETGVQFLDIAGNRTIVMTLIAPRRWRGVEEGASLVSEWDILTRPEEKRVAIEVPVERLHEMIPRLERARVKIDHVYDY